MDPTEVAPVVLALEDAPGHLVRIAQQRHTLLWSEEFGGDLTGPQYAVVSAVGRDGQVDQRTIGERASLDKSSTADVVARLAAQGWLQLQRDPDDGRRKRVRLTPLARTALPEVTRRAALVQTRLLDRLSGGEQADFLAVMRQVAYAGRQVLPGSVADHTGVLALRDTPGHLIRRSQQVHTELWVEEVGDVLTAPQYALVSALDQRDVVPDQTTVGRLAGLDRSSTADVVARLVRRGWVSRRRDPRDPRCQLLTLTPAAGTDLPAVTDAVRRVQQRLLAPLPGPGERRRWLDGYRLLAADD